MSRAPRGDTGAYPRTLDTPGHVTRIPGERPWQAASRIGKSWTRPREQAPSRENGATSTEGKAASAVPRAAPKVKIRAVFPRPRTGGPGPDEAAAN